MIKLESILKQNEDKDKKTMLKMDTYQENEDKMLKEILKKEILKKIEKGADLNDDKFTKTLKRFLADDEPPKEEKK